jgi:hypothetical protein
MPVFLKRTRASPTVMLRRFDTFPMAPIFEQDDDLNVRDGGRFARKRGGF